MQSADDTEFPSAAQFTLTSATMPSRMSKVLHNIINVSAATGIDIALKPLDSYVSLIISQVESLTQVSSDKLHHVLVPQKFMRVGPDDKPMELLKYIKSKIANKEPVIVFSNSNRTCNWVNMFLSNSNIDTVHMNGTMPMYVRSGKYANFKSGRCNVLCTTNAGSRGLDTVGVRHVLNYEFPFDTADYIHRYATNMSYLP